MKKTNKRAVLLLVLAMVLCLGGIATWHSRSSAAGGEYQEWLKDYESYGYDPYAKYYTELDVPSVLDVYIGYGEKAADNYIGWFKLSITDGNFSRVQTGAANLNTLFPPSENTPAPTPAPTIPGNPFGAGTGQIIKDDGIPVYDDEGNVIGLRDPVEGEPGYVAPGADPTDPPSAEETKPYVQYFDDVPEGAWYAEAVNAMAQTGLLKGKDDGLFHPDDILTEGEWCTIIWRIVGSKITPPEGTMTSGGNTGCHWASKAVFMCQSYGYSNMQMTVTDTLNQDGWVSVPVEYYYRSYGRMPASSSYEDRKVYVRSAGTYFENQPVIRGEAATSIMAIIADGDGTNSWHTLYDAAQKDLSGKLAARQKKNGAKTDWTLDQIPDGDVIEVNVEAIDFYHRWDVDSIIRAYNLGVLNGMDTSGTCDPYGTLTRAQACQMLYNALIFEPRPIHQRPY